MHAPHATVMPEELEAKGTVAVEPVNESSYATTRRLCEPFESATLTLMDVSGLMSTHSNLPESKMPQNATPPSVLLVIVAVAFTVTDPPTV
jgi:hypothetical protein